jgi:flavin reductase (DIM6/NTAB) family NADH-FMN oxidoreductase RutF
MPHFVPGDLAPRAAYHLLTGLVVPRPIAWVSTLSEGGTRNLAPHSYFNVISSDPPIVHFTSSGQKDTLRNARATGEFVVNVVSRDLVDAMNVTAASFPPGEDEFSWASLGAAPSTVVAPPRVADTKAALECRVREILSMGNGTMVFGEVVHFYVADDVWRDGRVQPELLKPVGRLSGSDYAFVEEIHRLPRLTVGDLRGEPR